MKMSAPRINVGFDGIQSASSKWDRPPHWEWKSQWKSLRVPSSAGWALRARRKSFTELGRVIRTLILQQFNNFSQWLMFGGDGVIAENLRHEQRKVIKYNQLVANMVILHNVQWMSRKLKELHGCGHPVTAEVLKALSSYRREHINRFGD